ncbi:MAG TPA: molybdopterin-dependent oxidoreductase [Deltaproteobacteria bacterium]|nr:molybdopterin-dependent oxidoreductase [Deltaproteobacteria bacterium]HPJ93952.1 molybdopterin-dependent oxidoreductase [Deltaproteobacteria bacterium]HPR51339.1 molybdopterin-dependent oxidoreductase [Deltaproteobacteria bacterium]
MGQYDQITACTLDCPDACSLVITEDSGGKVHARGNPDHPVTRGFACSKINTHLQRLMSPDRITQPLKRAGQNWEAISWDDALDLCAEKIRHYLSEPSSILYFHGEGAKGVVKQAGGLFFGTLGATLVRGSLCDSAGYGACMRDFGGRQQNDISQLARASTIVNWGKDLSRSSVHTAYFVRQARKNGARVITISPGGDGNRPYSDTLIQIRPGTDRFLAASAALLLMERSAVGDAVVSHTYNWDEFRDMMLRYSVGDLLNICEVSSDDLQVLYDAYTQGRPVATLIGAGLQRYSFGGENVRFINALSLLSGNIGRAGAGTYFHLNSMRNFNLSWARPAQRAEGRMLRMPMIARDILDAADPPIRMIWVDGANLINQVPDSNLAVQAFEHMEFKVVVDAFMTDTAQRADLILPPALILEEEDVVASYLHDYVHHAKALRNPPGMARSDHWILSEVGKRLDPVIDLLDVSSCMRLSLETDVLDISLEELKEKGFVRARGPVIAYEGMNFDHADKKYRFSTVLHAEPSPPEEFPLRLLTLIRKEAVHSQILPDHQIMPPRVWVSPDCPSLEMIDLKKDVFLVSELGRLKVIVELLPGLHKNTVLYRRGDWMKLGGGANRLVEARLTDMGSGAAYYDQYVRIENGSP